MKRQKVRSSSIRSVGYDAAGHVLEVEFCNGNVYGYFDVPPLTFDELVACPIAWPLHELCN